MNFIYRLYLRLTKFFYYGYYGSKYCVDYDSGCIHSLIYAHMRRVEKFMLSDNTHLDWNSDPNSKDMRRLKEFVELSRRMFNSGDIIIHNNYYFNQYVKNNPQTKLFDFQGENKGLAKALEKDRIISKSQTERYWHLLNNKLEHFWD